MLLLCISYVLVITSTATADLKIIGGTDAYAGEYPFSAAIYVQTLNGRYFCGGSLMTDEWILTAGLCVYNAVLFTIHLGSTSLTEEDPNRVTVSTSDYILHPDFNPDNIQNDIALIKLRMPITYSAYILPIFLPLIEVSDSVAVTALGWGQTSDDHSELSDHLQQTNVTVISNAECQTIYGSQVTENMTCVEGNFNEGTCIGDNGGPLVLFSNRICRVVAVASFVSANGCESTDPSGYTRTFPYSEWISNVIYN